MLYAITDRRLFGADETVRRERLLEQTRLWAANHVAFVQLREKDLSTCEQVELSRSMMGAIHRMEGSPTRLLINGRPDIALAAGADGVHLPSGADELTPVEVRQIFAHAGRSAPPIVSVSCHTTQEVETAREQRANLILFAPVFEKAIASGKAGKEVVPGSGLALLRQACEIAAPVPVLALGGVTAENAGDCLRAGATGIAAIRMMHEVAEEWRGFR